MTLLKNKRFIEEVILLIVFALSLIGMGLTDFSPLESHRYWVVMIILLAIASIGLGWSKENYQGKIVELAVRQLIHWGATLLTVLGVYLLLQTGRLNYESTGLIVGFSLFLDGRTLGWRISRKRSVPLFGKEGLGEILLDKSPSIPLLQRGR
jgi:hypothetical protein